VLSPALTPESSPELTPEFTPDLIHFIKWSTVNICCWISIAYYSLFQNLSSTRK